MEKKITCPVCFSGERCFEDVQEQADKTFSSFMCFKCGFMSDTRFKKDSLQTIENEKSTPKLIKDLKYPIELINNFY